MEIEEIISLAKSGKTIATFGDMINVPGESQSLQSMKTEGFDVKTVYSIDDAVNLAKKNIDKEIVFMAVGFETTAPLTAATIQINPPSNFSILCCHRVIPPALKAILDMGEIKIDGFIEPGHVSTIIGIHPYEFISRNYGIPQVVAGFEPIDILMGVWLLVQQIIHKKPKVENEYLRVVKSEGNIIAKKAMENVFDIKDIKWRGFPVIPNSGLILKNKFEKYDARIKYKDDLKEIKNKKFDEPIGCRCGDVLRGIISSKDCPLFGNKCKPNSPVGPCMVSIEGSCNIEYRYSK
jgi:hydrogenase expression/formation protein HypD